MRIEAIQAYLPETVLDNEALAILYPGWPSEKIFEKTGIRQRRISSENETATDLAEKAACALFRERKIDPSSVDFVLFCTQSPDYYLPTSACMLQSRLGIPTSAGALDFNLGCSGFVYGLALARGLLAGGLANRVLLLTAETYTKYIHPMDKSVRTIFGDGAAATLVVSDGVAQIGEFVFGTDGRGYQNLIVPVGGARKARSSERDRDSEDDSGNVRSENNLFMDGPEIFNFTLDAVPKAVSNSLERNGLRMEEIDLFVFHQANRFMLDILRKTIRIPRDKFYVNMEDIGNTVSASIPIALSRAEKTGVLKPGMKVMLVGFGVGLSWGATIITW